MPIVGSTSAHPLQQPHPGSSSKKLSTAPCMHRAYLLSPIEICTYLRVGALKHVYLLLPQMGCSALYTLCHAPRSFTEDKKFCAAFFLPSFLWCHACGRRPR